MRAETHTVSPFGSRCGAAARRCVYAASVFRSKPKLSSTRTGAALRDTPSSRAAALLTQAMEPSAVTPAKPSSGVPSSAGAVCRWITMCSSDCARSSRFSMAVACKPITAAASKPKGRPSLVTSSTPATWPCTSRIGAAAQCITCTQPKKCSAPYTTLGWPVCAVRPGALVPRQCSPRSTPTRAASGVNTCSARADECVACTTTPCGSVSSTVQAVPASAASSRLSSSAAVSSNRRLRASVECTRLGVTGLKARCSAGLRFACRQRDHDWITCSLTRPDGRTPSSK